MRERITEVKRRPATWAVPIRRLARRRGAQVPAAGCGLAGCARAALRALADTVTVSGVQISRAGVKKALAATDQASA